jgi:hypothetical protein
MARNESERSIHSQRTVDVEERDTSTVGEFRGLAAPFRDSHDIADTRHTKHSNRMAGRSGRTWGMTNHDEEHPSR